MTDVVVVSAPACHLCEDAVEALAELRGEYDLLVRVVDMGSPEGDAIMREHRPPMPPAVLVDGSLFSSGRLPRRKLRRFLERGE